GVQSCRAASAVRPVRRRVSPPTATTASADKSRVEKRRFINELLSYKKCCMQPGDPRKRQDGVPPWSNLLSRLGGPAGFDRTDALVEEIVGGGGQAVLLGKPPDGARKLLPLGGAA